MGTTMHALIARHANLLDRTEAEAVPRGWHAILDLLFRDLEEAMAAHPGILAMTPRGIRKAMQDTMVRAASQGRRRVAVEDVVACERDPAQRFGFHVRAKR